MRKRSLLLLAAALVATPLVAQRPARRADAPLVRQSLTVDLAAAVDERWRVFAEPIVLGAVTLGVSATWTTRADADGGSVPYLVEPAAVDVCTPEFCGGTSYPYYPYHERTTYRASSLNLHARWYPQLLARRGPSGQAAFYVGEFIGYHQRRLTTEGYFGWEVPVAGVSAQSVPPDSGRPYPLPPPPTRSRFTQSLRGWEPGLELGVRGALGRRAIIDLGASTRIVTIDDPRSTRRPGQMDPRLVLGVGLAW
jgi:hypothetical protein